MEELELQHQGITSGLIPLQIAEDVYSESTGLDKFTVTLPIYEGHFDALLEMIEKQDVDICDISLTDVTGQYLQYLSLAKAMNLSYASEFLAIAAHLLEMKSRRILPEEKEEEIVKEIETSLVDHVMQYRVFKKIAQVLKERKETFQRIFHRFRLEPQAAGNKQYFLKDVSVADLAQAFKKVWADVKDRSEGMEIVDETVTVEEKIEEIRAKVAERPSGLEFEALFRTKTRLEVIVTFLAVLELIRLKAVTIKQDTVFGQIYLFGSA